MGAPDRRRDLGGPVLLDPQDRPPSACDPANFLVYRNNYAVFWACYERLRGMFPLLAYSSG